MRLAAVLLAALLAGCGDETKYPTFAYHPSPWGYSVTDLQPRDMMAPGSSLDTMTQLEVEQLHAAVVDQAVSDNAVRYGWDAASQYATAQRYRWVLVDNCAYLSIYHRPSAWAAS